MPTAKLYLPKTADDYVDTVRSAKRRVADGYGGYTAYDGEGGWVGPDGSLVEEPVTIIETVTGMGADVETLATFMIRLAEDVKDATGEQQIMIVVDGDKHLI